MRRVLLQGGRCGGARAALLPLFVLVGVILGCGDRLAPGSSPSSSRPGAPPASAAATAWKTVEVGAAEAVRRSPQRLSLPYREYRRSGSWRVPDLTDRTAALMRNAGEHEQLWLMDVASGRTRRILARATNADAGFWIGTVHLSDSWLAWEEVGPGDDLVEAVDWKLYATPLRRPSLKVGQPVLVASGASAETARPLFDLLGSRLAWITTARTSSGSGGSSRLTMRDLVSDRQRVLLRSGGLLNTVNIMRDRAIVGETRRQEASRSRFSVLDFERRQPAVGFDVASEHSLAHWPAWRDGWLAWAPFPAEETTYPLLYLRDPSGRVFTEGGPAVDPCFVGPYLFYQTSRRGPAGRATTVEVRALRLSDMMSFVLESGDPDQGDWWSGIVGAPALKRTYVACLDRTLTAEKQSDRVTIIRVYAVR